MLIHNRLILMIFILTLTSTIHLRASDIGLPDAPSASHSQDDSSQGAPQPTQTPRRHAYAGASPATRGGSFGVDGQVIDWKYMGLTGGMFAATVANTELTQRCLDQGTCTFFPSALSSRAAMYGVGISADAAVAYFSYRLKRDHNPFWIVPEALFTGANLYVAAHSWSRLK
jgi:hypothetical protein